MRHPPAPPYRSRYPVSWATHRRTGLAASCPKNTLHIAGARRDTARAMSQENVERLRHAYEAFSRGDFDEALTFAHPDIEFVPPGDAAPYRGIEDSAPGWSPTPLTGK